MPVPLNLLGNLVQAVTILLFIPETPSSNGSWATDYPRLFFFFWAVPPGKWRNVSLIYAITASFLILTIPSFDAI
jgi:hypothetical protein